MSGFKNILLDPATVTLDAGSRLRTSQMTTLLDGKILNSDTPFLFDNAGTGTGTYANNKYTALEESAIGLGIKQMLGLDLSGAISNGIWVEESLKQL